uniref:Uncharacterized protein n=1 Tax=Panagrolaimus superbus TaxID=310955 RepID=A0A914YW86_9BILA
MEVDRVILTPKKSYTLKTIKTEPVSPKINFNDSIISATVGATPVTTDNEADNELSFIETRENAKFSGFKTCVLDGAKCVVLKNRYTADPSQLMTVETNGKQTIMHKTDFTPKKKDNLRFKVTENPDDKTSVTVELQKVISPKKIKTLSKYVVKKPVAKKNSELNSSDSSFIISPKKKVVIQKECN